MEKIDKLVRVAEIILHMGGLGQPLGNPPVGLKPTRTSPGKGLRRMISNTSPFGTASRPAPVGLDQPAAAPPPVGPPPVGSISRQPPLAEGARDSRRRPPLLRPSPSSVERLLSNAYEEECQAGTLSKENTPGPMDESTPSRPAGKQVHFTANPVVTGKVFIPQKNMNLPELIQAMGTQPRFNIKSIFEMEMVKYLAEVRWLGIGNQFPDMIYTDHNALQINLEPGR
ncbi:hypothetical protein N431DRAFT_446619 [Stipitochalara longipes BDJ]|nr:hypothetical protein N431DRAFT_446619 [Stipitochalara longipes BDJ]